MNRRLVLVVVTALALAHGVAARSDDAVPAYEVPAGLDPPALDAAPGDAARRAVAVILDPPTSEDAEDAVRVLAGLGRGTLPDIVRGLAAPSWRARAALVCAVAEMDAPDVTPILVAACGDPAFVVREIAVVGLGKTGDPRGAAALVAHAAPATEPVWRVRSAAAEALRRGVLRGVVERSSGEAALVRLLDDPDEDTRRVALREIAPLAAETALPTILAVFEDPGTPAADRTLALSALRAYRTAPAPLVAALRRGFLAGEDESETGEAGRALLAARGIEALADEEISEAIVHRLHESGQDALRDGLARLGRPAAPWLSARVLQIAERIAKGREKLDDTSFDVLLDTLIQVDEAAGLAVVRQLLTDKVSGDTRVAALRRVEFVFAARMGTELRALYDANPNETLAPGLLRVIAASGGDDLAGRIDAAIDSTNKDVRSEARNLLRRLAVPAGSHLVAFAREAADPKERREALESLAIRDPAEAAKIAVSLLDDPHALMRAEAIDVLSAWHTRESFDHLVARLSAEDGKDVAPSKPAGTETPPASITPSDHASRVASRRQKLMRALFVAIRLTGGDLAGQVLLHVAASDPDTSVRKDAAQQLTGLTSAPDAGRLVAMEAAEPDVAIRRELLRNLATLGDAPEAVARFDALIADSRTRSDAMQLISQEESTVAPTGLVEGLLGREWNDDERGAALKALARAGRAPEARKLAALVVDARTLDLCQEAANALAAVPGADATRELIRLLTVVEDPVRLSFVVQALGERADTESEAPLLELFAKSRDHALAATLAGDPSVNLYERCADAVAKFGSESTGAALADHLFDPRLARAAARQATMARGPFRPDYVAPIAILRTLVAAFALRDEETCRRLVAAQLAAMSTTARDLALPEGFAAGLARYLEAPAAYNLPKRPRPAAAALVWRLVTRIAPRMSALDLIAFQSADDQLGQEARYREAADALRAKVALSDVEDAARPREEKLLETCRIAVRTAQALAAEGKTDEALVVARGLRGPDPSSGELAYRTGWCLVRVGQPGPEARDALLFAAAQNDKDARIRFQLGWIAEQTEGHERALAYYEQAIDLDAKRVRERDRDESVGYHGAPVKAAAYLYWCSRALHAAGQEQPAAERLSDAIALDDRFAAQALTDAAFAGWEQRDEVVKKALGGIRRGALR